MAHHLTKDNDDLITQSDITKLDLITITTPKNLEDIYNAIVNNAATLTTTNSNRGLFTHLIKFKINGAYTYSGLTNTGSPLSTTNPLTSTLRRYKLLREDTYDSNIVLSNNDTTFTPNETGTYLSVISAEIYDNSATTKTIQLELYGHSEIASLQVVRHTFTGTSTSFEYAKTSDTQVVTLTAGNQYYYRVQSTNGGVVNAFTTTTNFTLMKIRKSF
mgnify:CR=1 FL=1|tara:strand:+ start:1848 stop:2498 length:651 start_codon:yes stop_codon:yes gene_type:complete